MYSFKAVVPKLELQPPRYCIRKILKGVANSRDLLVMKLVTSGFTYQQQRSKKHFSMGLLTSLLLSLPVRVVQRTWKQDLLPAVPPVGPNLLKGTG